MTASPAIAECPKVSWISQKTHSAAQADLVRLHRADDIRDAGGPGLHVKFAQRPVRRSRIARVMLEEFSVPPDTGIDTGGGGFGLFIWARFWGGAGPNGQVGAGE